MNAELIAIFERAMIYSIWVLLASFLLFLLIARSRLKKKRRQIGEFYAEGPDAPLVDREREIAASILNPWQIVFNSLLLALGTAVTFAAFYLFVPLPVFQNFAAGSDWQISPLRVTSLHFDRFYEGFSVEGEVWNQTEEPIGEVQARVTVVGSDDRPLDEILVPIDPEILPPGRPGSFEVRYAQNSPFIKGYRLSFERREGEKIPHVTGFDVE